MGRHEEPFRSYFYPRSPCGERLKPPCVRLSIEVFLSTLSLRRATRFGRVIDVQFVISIHALLAESDRVVTAFRGSVDRFLSTLSLRRATPQHNASCNYHSISIHALLAESDREQ